MAYTKTSWVDNTTPAINAANLNNIEAGAESANLMAAADYVIFKTVGASTFQARGRVLADVAANADCGSVLQSCLDNMNSSTSPRGLIVFAPDTTFAFTGGTTPAFRRTYASGGSDDSRWLRILGTGGSVIQFTSATSTGRRFLKFNRQADYDGFCGLEIGFLEFDDNNGASSSDAVIGVHDDTGPTDLQRVDFRRMYFHDLSAYNCVPGGSASSKQRQMISLNISHAAVSETTQNQITDIKIQRIRTRGFPNSVSILGFNNLGGSLAGLNLFGDNIYISDIDHDTGSGTNPGAKIAASIVQVGAGLFGDRMVLERIKGIGSGDDGIEVNNFRDIVVRDCEIWACTTQAFICAQFNYVNGVDNTEAQTQTCLFENCVAKLNYPGASNAFHGWAFWGAGNASCDQGTIILRGCKTECGSTPNPADNPGSAISGQTLANTIDQIILEDCTFDHFRNWNSASSENEFLIYTQQLPRRFVVRDLKLIIRGAQQSTGAMNVYPFYINGKWSGGSSKLDVDGVTIHDLTTGRGSFQTVYCFLGNSSDTSDFGGTIRRYYLATTPAITSTGFQIGAATHLTLRKLLIEDCDFSKLSDDTRYILYSNGTDNQSVIFIRNPKRAVANQPEISFTPGATTVSAQYIGNFEGLMTITGGTVTAVQVSTDNSTFRQVASGTNCAFYIDHGMYVKLTYSVAPTCAVIPRH